MVFVRAFNPVSAPTSENIDRCLKTITGLVNSLQTANFPWSVVGGLGNDLHNGDITRQHDDLDIEISLSDAKEALRLFASIGAPLMRPILALPVSLTKVAAFYVPATERDCSLLAKRALKIILPSREGWLAHIDVYFCNHMPEGTQVGYRGHSWTIPFVYQPSESGALINGKWLNLRNPMYQGCVVWGTSAPKNLHDLKNIRQLVGEKNYRELNDFCDRNRRSPIGTNF